MKNNFKQGDIVVCISENFPLIEKYGVTGEEAKFTPQKGETLKVDEVLGEFIRFDKYDTEESYNWWKFDRFAPVVDVETQEELISEVNIILNPHEKEKNNH